MAGDAILHPVALGAVALLLLNDHVLKGAWPGPLTGKLSDVAGLAFFPLFLVGAWEVLLWLFGRWRRPSRRAAIVASAATALAFAIVKTTPAGAEAFGWGVALGQWLPAAVRGAAAGAVPSPHGPAVVVADATDLIALPAVLLDLAIALRRARGAVTTPSS